MLLTAAARIEQLEGRRGPVGVVGLVVSRGDRWRSWKVNTWALIIVFHYSLGTRLSIDWMYCPDVLTDLIPSNNGQNEIFQDAD